MGGRLTAPVLRHLAAAGRAGPDVRRFVTRLCAQFSARGIPAEDFSTYLAWSAATFVPRLLPSAWDGVAPITVAGRHRRLDEYLAGNPWRRPRPGDRILDLGCGFPALTTFELAARFPTARVTGADPVAGRYLVRLGNGDVGCFTATLGLVYFQPGSNSAARWQAMHADRARTRRRFLAPLRLALAGFSSDGGGTEFARVPGALVWKNPGPGTVELVEAAIGSRLLGRHEIIRAMNVLPYLAQADRRRAAAWFRDRLTDGGLLISGVDGPETRHARYRVEQRRGGRMVLRELAMSLDQIRPLEVTAFFALHDDDPDLPVFNAAIRTIRSDPGFMEGFDRRMDALLARERFCRRTVRGHLGGTPGRGATARLAAASRRIDQALRREGFAARACRVLRRHGYAAWVNQAGHVAFRPQ